jgi:cell division protein FtsB
VSRAVAGDFKTRRQESVWHFLNRLVFTLILFAVITATICIFLPEMKKRSDQYSRIEHLKTEIAREKKVLDQRTREIDLLQNDPVYVEALARDRLDLMKEDETIFRFQSGPERRDNPADRR